MARNKKAPASAEAQEVKTEAETKQVVTAEMLEAQKQEELEAFVTPPAGVYPKTDKKGRVIKYKRRGGVFAFFMGIFATLFLFVFCGGLAVSYFYYCYKVEDASKMIGVDLSFMSDDPNAFKNNT